MGYDAKESDLKTDTSLVGRIQNKLSRRRRKSEKISLFSGIEIGRKRLLMRNSPNLVRKIARKLKFRLAWKTSNQEEISSIE